MSRMVRGTAATALLPRDDELRAMLASNDSRLVKRGLQRLCDAIEAGVPVDLRRDPSLVGVVAGLKGSTDTDVLAWLYKLVALLGDRAWSPWLAAQLAGRETDPVNVCWAYAALTALEGTLTASRLLARAGHDPQAQAARLATGYFRPGTPVDHDLLRAALHTDDPLAHRWLGLRRGKDVDSLPREALYDLTTSGDPVVVEHALWAAYRDPVAGLGDAAIDPVALSRHPPNVRRWYVRLLVRDEANLLPYLDLVRAAMADDAVLVREGLALGLTEGRLPAYLVDDVLAWVARETDPLVRLALDRLVRRHGRYAAFRRVRESQPGEETSQSHRAVSVPARVFVPRRKRVGVERRMSALPVIAEESQHEVYVLGIDTVDFSKRTDRQQYTIFRDLLDALRHEDVVARQEATDLAVLPTGDGVFVCFRGSANRLAPLKAALRLRREFAELRSYTLRFGVNAGPATWITMRDGTSQVISHAVNWTARVMAAATANQVLASATYYLTYVRPAADEFPGVAFTGVPGHRTKHGEELAVYEATELVPERSADAERGDG